MAMLTHRQPPPSAQDAALARASGQLLSRYTQGHGPLMLRVRDAGQDQPLELPKGAAALLMDILEAMAAGRGVTLIPEKSPMNLRTDSQASVEMSEPRDITRPNLSGRTAKPTITKVGRGWPTSGGPSIRMRRSSRPRVRLGTEVELSWPWDLAASNP